MRGFGTTIFAEMTALAVEHGAVNLGQGFPDTDGPPGMLARAAQALGEGLNQYPPGPGVPALREAVAADRLRRYGHGYDPATEVVVTVGATEAISAAVLALCEAGDEVLGLEPYSDSYAAAIALAAAVRVPVPLRPATPGGRFDLDVDALRAAVTPRTKVLLLNSPHNPTGTVLTDAELRAVAEVAVEHDLVVITDEVYEHLVYDGVEHLPLAGYDGMRERTLCISSAGKTFSVTGWKTGWACGPAHLVRALLTVKQFLTFTNNAPAQVAVAYALEHELAWVAELRASLQARRDQLAAGLRDIGLDVSVPQGTYFLQADVRGLGAPDATAFARDLPVSHGVVAIPTAAFTDAGPGGPWSPYLRFAFCKQADVLDEAVRRLHAGR
jgi:N-succinyldiaminopimelate aminotransferase